MFGGQWLAIRLVDLAQLGLLIQLILKAQSLYAQLCHFGIQLLRFWHLGQTRNLSAQRLAQQIRRTQPLGLFAKGIQRLAHLRGLTGCLALLRGHQIHTLRLLVKRGRKLPVDFELLNDAGG